MAKKEVIKAWAFFITTMVILPLAGVAVAIWQRSCQNEAWSLILVASLSAGGQIWIFVICQYLKLRRQKD